MSLDRQLRSLVAGAAVFAAVAVPATAGPLVYFDTVTNIDYAYFGTGGMRGNGTGSIAVTGVTGTVTRAVIHWHGPSNSTDPTAGAAVTFNGTDIVGTSIGFADDNCWGFANSQAYYAEVTGLVSGDGTYSLTNFLGSGFDMNGVTLELFYDDGNGTNNRDIVMFHGNDSNITSVFDPDFWQAALAGINYSGGDASVVLTVADGQEFGNDETVFFNSSLTGTHNLFTGPSFNGLTVPKTGAFAQNLWDVTSADISSFLGLGINNCSIFTTNVAGDCLGLISVSFNLPAGAAPPPPDAAPVPEPATVALVGIGLALVAARRRMGRRA
jgi:hypothetical protein